MWVEDGWRLAYKEARVMGVRTGRRHYRSIMLPVGEEEPSAYWLVSWAERGRGLKGAGECGMWVEDGWRLAYKEARVMGAHTGRRHYRSIMLPVGPSSRHRGRHRVPSRPPSTDRGRY